MSETLIWPAVANVLKLTNQQGEPVTDLGPYFADVVNRVLAGALAENDPEFQNIVKKLANLSADWLSYPQLETLMSANRAGTIIDGVLNTMYEAVQVRACQEEQDLYQARKDELQQSGYLIERKLNDGDEATRERW